MSLITILQHTPAWVWSLFVTLTAFGLRQTREREMSLARVTVLPLVMLGLSMAGVLTAFGGSTAALVGWGSGVAAALFAGRSFIQVRGAVWLPMSGRLRVPGSWLPMALMMGLFAVKYAVGVRLAMHHELAVDPVFAGLISLAYGSFSGLFLCRGIALRRAARPVAAPAEGKPALA